jgi:hypothetical protein
MAGSSDEAERKKASGRSDERDNALGEWSIQTGVFGVSTPGQGPAKGVAHPMGYDPYSSADAVKTVDKLKAP